MLFSKNEISDILVWLRSHLVISLTINGGILTLMDMAEGEDQNEYDWNDKDILDKEYEYITISQYYLKIKNAT